uniref:Lon proteolytic domain-containing protein n=1 Tax=viral metagenome TaxID=1070528 RepID=A0A6C0IPL0_9ZZZZ
MNKLKKNKSVKKKSDYEDFITEKLMYIQTIIQNTILSIKDNIKNDLFSNNDSILPINVLTELYGRTIKISNKIKNRSYKSDFQDIFDDFQVVIDKLAVIICVFGTQHVDDLLFISFGSEFKDLHFTNSLLQCKYELIKQFIQPTGYKIIHWKKEEEHTNSSNSMCSNKITENMVEYEKENTLECFYTHESNISFHQKVNGIRVVFQNEKAKKTLILNGIIKDIPLDCFTNNYIQTRIHDLHLISKSYKGIEKDIFINIIGSLWLKDILIYGDNDFQKLIIGVIVEGKNIKQTTLDVSIKKFLELNIFEQRSMLVNLLLHSDDNEIKYICYMLYDLINDQENTKTLLFDSLPWKLQKHFNDHVQFTLKYKEEINDRYSVTNVSLEQQILFLNVNEVIKEKAITKLQEIKGKPEELCYKTKQYLEGLIKIPFGNYRTEPILKNMKEINHSFKKVTLMLCEMFSYLQNPNKLKYTCIEITDYLEQSEESIENTILENIRELLNQQSCQNILKIGREFNKIKHKEDEKLIFKNKSKIENINTIVEMIMNRKTYYFEEIIKLYDKLIKQKVYSLDYVYKEIKNIYSSISKNENQIQEMYNKLDNSIHSHQHAKNQIMKIFGQWINGEQTGYCFGFEGSAGIGKTSLAKKGLTTCLINENGESRPFAFIALGGSANGSTLEGHSFTYVNSTWGRIVDILIETKCMNPIIYVDELDKVSKTDHGKEIIGILTHLIDQTQNDGFQDKYFSGIDIDLSKALFIFSYNDPDQIDKILLDRIHRIKFENLTIEEKVVIVNKYILPELNIKMGFENIVEMDNDIIRYIIEYYTNEPGVRKLKEILFDLYGAINLEILKSKNSSIKEIPIQITTKDIDDNYLDKYTKIIETKINPYNETGIINGLWANSLGMGGIIPIQTLFYPSSTFLDLQLTGLQGDVMKESMSVAKSLAWSLTSDETKKKWLAYFQETKCQGLHIHCPEGSISKDGPSAGTAITTAIYSLLNNKKIKNTIAVTGEISLNGNIMAIGGLAIKINGGLKAGITTFLYPSANHKDFIDWKKKATLENDQIQFIEISNIKEVFKHVFI